MLLDDWLHDKRLQNKDFAEKIGVSEMSVSRYRRGRWPRRRVVLRIVEGPAGAVTADDLNQAAVAAGEAAVA